MTKKSISRRIYKKGVSSQILSGFLKLIGGTMSGAIEMGGNRVNNPLLTWVDGFVKISRSAIDPLLKLDFSDITSNRTIVFQNKDHTLAGLDDIKDRNFNSTTNNSHTGTTDETILTSFLIPANTFAAGDLLMINAQNYKSANVGSVDCLVKINTSLNLSGANLLATHTTVYMDVSINRRFFINHLNASNNTRGNTSPYFSYPTDLTLTQNQTVSERSVTINWGVDQYIMITGKLADSSEVINNEMFSIQRLRQ